MKTFKIIETKTLVTEIEIKAESMQEANEKYLEGTYGDILSKAEVEQWNVVDDSHEIEEIKPRKWARMCDVTNEGMNEGYVYGDGEMYFKYQKDLIAHIREGSDESFNDASDEFILNQAYELDEYYWTEWDDDAQYIEINGVLTEIE